MFTEQQLIIWKKFKKNKPALLGLFFILLAMVVTILGANIRPDDTENANEMSISLSRKKPGFKQVFLFVPTANPTTENNKSFFEKTFFGGNQSSFKIVPIANYAFKNNRIHIVEFAEEGFAGDTSSYAISEFGNSATPQNISQNNIHTIQVISVNINVI